MIEYKEVSRTPIEFYKVVTHKYITRDYAGIYHSYQAVCDGEVIESAETLSDLLGKLDLETEPMVIISVEDLRRFGAILP